MTTITTMSSSRQGCKLANERSVAKRGTVINCVQNGNGRWYHGKLGRRKQPSCMCSNVGSVPLMNANEPRDGNPECVKVSLSAKKLPV